MAIAFCSAQFTLVAHLLVYVNKGLGRTLIFASLFLAFAQLAGAIGRIVFGVISDTVFNGRRKPPLIICGILMALMAAAMALVGPATPSIIIGLLIILFGSPLFGFVVDATGSYGAGWWRLSLVVVIGVLAFTMVEEINHPPQRN